MTGVLSGRKAVTMSRYCPLLKRNVVYLDCKECDDKEACDTGALEPENTSKQE